MLSSSKADIKKVFHHCDITYQGIQEESQYEKRSCSHALAFWNLCWEKSLDIGASKESKYRKIISSGKILGHENQTPLNETL